MFIFTLTEGGARSVATTFGIIFLVLLVAAPLVVISSLTGMPFEIVLAVGIIIVILVLAFFFTRAYYVGKQRAVELAANQALGVCEFIRANRSRCEKFKVAGQKFCEYHTQKAQHVEPVVPPSTARAPRKRSQCGFIQDDGSKCRKLKPLDMKRCDQHSSVAEVAP